VRQEWEPEDLVGAWTLVEDDWRRIANKRGATRLGFALLLKFFELEARFPDDPNEFPAAVVGYVGEQVGMAPGSSPATTGGRGRSSTTGPRSARRSSNGTYPLRPDLDLACGSGYSSLVTETIKI